MLGQIEGGSVARSTFGLSLSLYESVPAMRRGANVPLLLVLLYLRFNQKKVEQMIAERLDMSL